MILMQCQLTPSYALLVVGKKTQCVDHLLYCGVGRLNVASDSVTADDALFEKIIMLTAPFHIYASPRFTLPLQRFRYLIVGIAPIL